MKSILIAAALASLLPAQTITWTKEHEISVQNSATQFASNLSSQMVIVGRLGLSETRPAVVISLDGHILSPFLPSIDGEDAPYLLYRIDGSRIELETVAENPKRFVSLLKIKQPPPELVPVRVSKTLDHTVLVPTTAPISSIGEPPSLFVDHLEFAPPEEAKALRLDSTLYTLGAPVFDLSGALIATTLKGRETNTPALMIQWLIADFPELDAILANETTSDLEKLPLAPKTTKEEAKKSLSRPSHEQGNVSFKDHTQTHSPVSLCLTKGRKQLTP